MPPLPPGEPSRPPFEAHRARQMAESFGTDVEGYDRARPGYPAALLKRLVATSPGPDTLDVGCGTGIAARQFQAGGCTVLGVEPDAPFNGRSSRRPLDQYQAMYTAFADSFTKTRAFSPPEQWRFDWERDYSRDEWLDLLPTTGGLTRLPPDKLAAVLDAVGAAIDSIGGRFTMEYTTCWPPPHRAPAGVDGRARWRRDLPH